VVGASERTLALVHLYGGDEKPVRRTRRKAEGFVQHIGRATLAALGELERVVSFFGSMVVAAVGVVRRPKSGNFGEIPALVERAGMDAVPIVLLLNFLLGFVMGFQAARQLETYGGSIYVADLVGISVTRELAPLMTAIIVCGRSGAAFAAELGTMRVSEEMDALRTMGVGPVRYLVLPRTIALMIVVPVLTLLGDIVGILGGLVVAVTTLKLTATAYLTESRLAIAARDVESGLLKSVAFALAIGLIACQQGFATSGGAKGVGTRTTSTVVISLFAIVLIDAVFTVFYRAVGL
jgi:phospholipid/cholesterol/gamma-HCH transport system permease protein